MSDERKPSVAVYAALIPQDRLLTSADVCRILSIRRLQLYELLRRSELRSVRVGRQHRFIPADIAAYIAGGGSGGQS
jgi:excisionase family DNA binding protein